MDHWTKSANNSKLSNSMQSSFCLSQKFQNEMRYQSRFQTESHLHPFLFFLKCSLNLFFSPRLSLEALTEIYKRETTNQRFAKVPLHYIAISKVLLDVWVYQKLGSNIMRWWDGLWEWGRIYEKQQVRRRNDWRWSKNNTFYFHSSSPTLTWIPSRIWLPLRISREKARLDQVLFLHGRLWAFLTWKLRLTHSSDFFSFFLLLLESWNYFQRNNFSFLELQMTFPIPRAWDLYSKTFEKSDRARSWMGWKWLMRNI